METVDVMIAFSEGTHRKEIVTKMITDVTGAAGIVYHGWTTAKDVSLGKTEWTIVREKLTGVVTAYDTPKTDGLADGGQKWEWDERAALTY